jgi:hypothetical protein
MSAARRTLGRWLLAAFLERGCDPSTARQPRRVFAVRPLTAHELAALTAAPLALVSLSNLRRLPARSRPDGLVVV